MKEEILNQENEQEKENNENIILNDNQLKQDQKQEVKPEEVQKEEEIQALNVNELEKEKNQAEADRRRQQQQIQRRREEEERNRRNQMQANQMQANLMQNQMQNQPQNQMQQGMAQPNMAQPAINMGQININPNLVAVGSQIQGLQTQMLMMQQNLASFDQQLMNLKQMEQMVKEEEKAKLQQQQQQTQQQKEIVSKQLEAARQEVSRLQVAQQKMMQDMQMNQALQNQQNQQQMQQNQPGPRPKPQKRQIPTTPLSAEEIRKKLQADILDAEKKAKDASSGKNSKKIMPGGIQAKYYYAAIRDYHKDLLKKISELPNENLQKKYYSAYFNQDMANRYIRSRAKDPTYRHMVDTYKPKQVMEAYNKYSYDRKHPHDFGYEPFVKDEKGFNHVQEFHPFKTDNYLYRADTYNEDSAWEQFRQKVINFNGHVEDRFGDNINNFSKEAILQKADILSQEADGVINAYKGDWRGRGKPYVEEARNIKAYVNDIKTYGYEAANLRQTLREKVKAAEGIQAGFENAQEVADALVAKQLLGNTEKSKEFWNQFGNQNVAADIKYATVVNNIEKMRRDVMTDPLFSHRLRENMKMEDFTAKYSNDLHYRNKLNKEAQAKEIKRQKDADKVFKERRKKAQSKQNKKLEEEQKNIRKLNALGK